MTAPWWLPVAMTTALVALEAMAIRTSVASPLVEEATSASVSSAQAPVSVDVALCARGCARQADEPDTGAAETDHPASLDTLHTTQWDESETRLTWPMTGEVNNVWLAPVWRSTTNSIVAPAPSLEVYASQSRVARRSSTWK